MWCTQKGAFSGYVPPFLRINSKGRTERTGKATERGHLDELLKELPENLTNIHRQLSQNGHPNIPQKKQAAIPKQLSIKKISPSP